MLPMMMMMRTVSIGIRATANATRGCKNFGHSPRELTAYVSLRVGRLRLRLSLTALHCIEICPKYLTY